MPEPTRTPTETRGRWRGVEASAKRKGSKGASPGATVLLVGAGAVSAGTGWAGAAASTAPAGSWDGAASGATPSPEPAGSADGAGTDAAGCWPLDERTRLWEGFGGLVPFVSPGMTGTSSSTACPGAAVDSGTTFTCATAVPVGTDCAGLCQGAQSRIAATDTSAAALTPARRSAAARRTRRPTASQLAGEGAAPSERDFSRRASNQSLSFNPLLMACCFYHYNGASPGLLRRFVSVSPETPAFPA